MTHAEKDKLIEALTAKVEAAEELLTRKIVTTDLTKLGFSVIKEDRMYKLVKIKFDVESGQAQVSGVVSLNKDYAIAFYKVKKFLVENIMNILK